MHMCMHVCMDEWMAVTMYACMYVWIDGHENKSTHRHCSLCAVFFFLSHGQDENISNVLTPY